MKKLISLLMALLVIPAFVSAETTIETHWMGSGDFETHFNFDDDSETHFWTGGNSISGELYATDYNDNPYNYGVDTSDVKVRSHVENGGYIEYVFRKTDNYEPMYGSAGQESYTYISTSDTGDFAWHSWSNYAQLRNSNYGWQNDNQIEATGDHFIHHYFFIDENYNEGASITLDASGSTSITDMCEDHWGSRYKFGKGCGCYTNANVYIDGSGTFELNAWADNEIVTDTGIHITGNPHYIVHADFDSGFEFENFALEGN